MINSFVNECCLVERQCILVNQWGTDGPNKNTLTRMCLINWNDEWFVG
jgi:hypothetical protein